MSRSLILALGLAVASIAAVSPQVSVAAPPKAAPAAAPAKPAPMKVANFNLKDQNGKAHDLYALKDKKAVVLVMQGVGCPIVQKLTPSINDIAAQYGAKNVEFLMVNSNLADTPAAIKAEATSFSLKVPVLKDTDQKVGMALKVERTAEAIVIDPKTWTVVYHGAIDDRLDYGRERPKPTERYVATVLDAMLTGAKVPEYHAPASGCIINFEKKA